MMDDRKKKIPIDLHSFDFGQKVAILATTQNTLASTYPGNHLQHPIIRILVSSGFKMNHTLCFP